MQKCGKYSQKSVIPGRRKITPFSLALLLCFCLALGETSQAGAETPVCGHITANITWEKVKSPYIVTCGVIVDSGITLTIEAGVEVRFNTNCSLTIDGTLIARGTSLDPIVFTHNNQYWAYIHFRDGSTDAVYDARWLLRLRVHPAILHRGVCRGVGGVAQRRPAAGKCSPLH